MELKVVFVLLLLATVSFSTFLDDLQYALPIVIMIMVLLLMSALMLSRTLSLPQLEAWVKTEIRELIIAAILFIIIYSVFAGADLYVGMLTGQEDYKTMTLVFTNNMITEAKEAYLDVMMANHYLGIVSGYYSSTTVDLWYAGVTFSGSPYSGFSIFMTGLSRAAQGLTTVIFIYTAISLFLEFFITLGPKLLVLAFVFRFIPFTRKLGTTLIALLIGAYILFPVSLVLVQNFHGLPDCY